VKKQVHLIKSNGFANFLSMLRTIDLALRTLQNKINFQTENKTVHAKTTLKHLTESLNF
jgi:hypothetical protein